MLKVTKDAYPQINVDEENFKKYVDENGLYSGIPKEYFDIKRDFVYMSSEIAHLLDWNIDFIGPTYINVNAYAKPITIDGETYNIPAGTFCANIKGEHFVEDFEDIKQANGYDD